MQFKSPPGLHELANYIKLDDYLKEITFSLLMLLGLWIYYHRGINIWLLISVCSLFAYFWTYYRWYDDIIILIPIITLFRMTKAIHFSEKTKLLSGLLLVISIILSIAPGGHYLFPGPFDDLYIYSQFIAWISVFAFLLKISLNERARVTYKESVGLEIA